MTESWFPKFILSASYWKIQFSSGWVRLHHAIVLGGQSPHSIGEPAYKSHDFQTARFSNCPVMVSSISLSYRATPRSLLNHLTYRLKILSPCTKPRCVIFKLKLWNSTFIWCSLFFNIFQTGIGWFFFQLGLYWVVKDLWSLAWTVDYRNHPRWSAYFGVLFFTSFTWCVYQHKFTEIYFCL